MKNPIILSIPFIITTLILIYFNHLGYINLFVTLTLITILMICYSFYIYHKTTFFLAMLKSVISEFCKTKKLENPIPKQGDAIMQSLISSLNKMMLELQAYNFFHLDQVLDERNKSEAIIDILTDAIVLINPLGAIIHCNSPFLKLMDIHCSVNEKLEIKKLKDSKFKDILNEILTTTKKKGDFEIINIEKNKKDVKIATVGGKVVQTEIFEEEVKKSYRINYKKFTISSLKQEGIIVIIRDITAEKEIENLKEDFFHMITHDMRTPVSSIKGYAEIIALTENLSPKGKDNIRIIISAAKKVSGMIDDILNTMKMENNKLALNLEKINILDLFTQIKKNHLLQAEIKNINLSSKIQGEPFIFTADRHLLERVISNLVTNALKFTPKDGKVEIQAEKKGKNIYIYVSDTGPGIPENKKKDIFKKYVQMEEHRNQGFGLGLAMCKMAVDLHGGNIQVESEVGKGSKFIIMLPDNEKTTN